MPCEYTAETRTSHGPSKGYVHHLESKLRELQNASIAQHDVPADRPQLFSAINQPRNLEGTWSTASASPAPNQYHVPFGYAIRDHTVTHPLSASPAPTTTKVLSSLPSPVPSIRAASQTTANPDWGGPLRAQPLGVPRTPDGSVLNRTMTPSALRGSMEVPSPLMPGGPQHRPLIFNRADFKDGNGSLDQSMQRMPSLTASRAHITMSPAPRPGYFASRRTASFVRQIRSAIDSRFQSYHSPPRRPNSRGLSLGPPKMEPKSNVPQNIDYILPSRKTADSLLRIYWDDVYPFFPFLNKKEFEEAYDGIWSGVPSDSDESLMMCTLNVVFALASQYSEGLLATERETAAGKFFDRAQDLLNLDLWGTGSVQLVQCLLLMVQYLQSINSLHQCWMVGGVATRVAEGLGLHLPETSANAPCIRQREHLRRLWHGCILLDRCVHDTHRRSCRAFNSYQENTFMLKLVTAYGIVGDMVASFLS